jgi:hypothetical protein
MAVMVLARQLKGEEPGTVATDEKHRAVLSAGVVLLERHPRPDHLAGVRSTVGPW